MRVEERESERVFVAEGIRKDDRGKEKAKKMCEREERGEGKPRSIYMKG